MTATRLLTRRHLRHVSVGAAAAACLIPVSGWGQTRASVDVSAGAIATSNPYLLHAPETAAAGANLTIDPSLLVETGNASVSFDGTLSLEKYFSRYGFDKSANIGGSGEFRVDERTTLTADVGFRTSKSAARRYYDGANLFDLGPNEFPDSSIVDPTLANLGGRTSRLDANASVEHILNPRSVLTASMGLGLTRAASASARDYRDTNFTVGYNAKLAEKTSALVTLDMGYADYLNQRVGDGVFGTAMVGVDHQITESLHLSSQLGASFASVEALGGRKHESLTWAGKVDLCDKYSSDTACITGGRSTRPTALGGITTVNSVGATYARSFGEGADLSLTGTYALSTRSRAAVGLSARGRSELVTVRATYRHKVGERLSAFVTPSATAITDDISGRRKDYQVLLGLSYRLGTTP